MNLIEAINAALEKTRATDHYWFHRATADRTGFEIFQAMPKKPAPAGGDRAASIAAMAREAGAR